MKRLCSLLCGLALHCRTLRKGETLRRGRPATFFRVIPDDAARGSRLRVPQRSPRSPLIASRGPCRVRAFSLHSMVPSTDRQRAVKLERHRSISSDVSMHVSRLSNNGGQLIVVANRLPVSRQVLAPRQPPGHGVAHYTNHRLSQVSVTADPSAEGGYRFSVSSGGLASALSGCKKKMDFVVSSRGLTRHAKRR